MGQALARAAEWTSAASGGRGKLALTPINEKLIREIVEFTEAIPSRHSECGSIEFQKPIVYSSYLDASVFGGSGYFSFCLFVLFSYIFIKRVMFQWFIRII